MTFQPTPTTKGSAAALNSLSAIPEPSPKPISSYLTGNKTVRARIAATRQSDRKPELHIFELEDVVVLSQVMQNELGLDVDVETFEAPILNSLLAVSRFSLDALVRSLGFAAHGYSVTLNEEEKAWFFARFVGKTVEIVSRTRETKSGAFYTQHDVKLLSPSPFIFDEDGNLIIEDTEEIPPPPIREWPTRRERERARPRFEADVGADIGVDVQPLVLDADGVPTACRICGRSYCDHPRRS